MRSYIIPAAIAASFSLLHPGIPVAKSLSEPAVAEAPPPLPIYQQPTLPAAGLIWTPGYWAHAEAGYYWVPGLWVRPPSAGLLWTPGYWARTDDGFVFAAGYWARHVGFYGDMDYGFGYGGFDYDGAAWRHGRLEYNTAVNNLGTVPVGHSFSQAITYKLTVVTTSYSGVGGTSDRPTALQLVYAHERHLPPTAAQRAIADTARTERSFLASVNHGRPPMPALPSRPG